MTSEEEQNQPKAEHQDSPEAQSMETNSTADDPEKEEKEKRREAKVCSLFTKLTCKIPFCCFLALLFRSDSLELNLKYKNLI